MKDDKQPYTHKHMVEVLDTIMAKWHDNPHLRLGQLLVVATNCTDLFNIEDYILVNEVRGLDREDKNAVSTQLKDESGKASSTVNSRSLGASADEFKSSIADALRDSFRSKRQEVPGSKEP